jgi:hypothetical protein
VDAQYFCRQFINLWRSKAPRMTMALRDVRDATIRAANGATKPGIRRSGSEMTLGVPCLVECFCRWKLIGFRR